MTKYVLDTNLYIRAFRNTADARRLERFYAAFSPIVFLSSVVLHELLVGATSPGKTRQLRELVARPFKRSRRVLTPSANAWEVAGEAIAAGARSGEHDLRRIPKSLVNDYLLAASCRESGATLITDDVRDFESISRRIDITFDAPWPV